LSDASPAGENEAEPAAKGVSKGLGLNYQDPKSGLKSRMDPSSPRGPVVTEVDPEGPAARAGIQPGDIVLKVADQAIPNAATLGKVLSSANLRRGVRVFVWRDGVTLYGFLQSDN
jgi:serine protease Do